MDWGGPGFVIAIIGLSMGAWVITTWIKARHGYPLEDGAGGQIERRDDGSSQRLLEVNRGLTDRLENTEVRLAVLERIITDQGYSTAREIEALRDIREKN